MARLVQGRYHKGQYSIIMLQDQTRSHCLSARYLSQRIVFPDNLTGSDKERLFDIQLLVYRYENDSLLPLLSKIYRRD